MLEELSKMLRRKMDGECPMCGKDMGSGAEFRNALSIREFEITGMCQECQDGFFEDEPQDPDAKEEILIEIPSKGIRMRASAGVFFVTGLAGEESDTAASGVYGRVGEQWLQVATVELLRLVSEGIDKIRGDRSD